MKEISYESSTKLCSRYLGTIPGHACVLQVTDSTPGPKREQSLPPFSGFGLLHSLCRTFDPPPHDFVQAEYFDHCP